MSLISLATRIVLARILSGRTWAADRILDQPLDPISEVLRGADRKQRPVIAIYTSQAKGKPVGLETQGGVQAVTMTIYVYLPPARIDLPEEVEFAIDNVGSGLALNTMGRQIDAAMHFGHAAWIALWRRFVLHVDDKVSRFVLVQVENGVKVPCMEVVYDLNCVADADFGKPLYGGWADLDALLRADGPATEGELLADHLKSLIELPAALQDYEVFQGNFGLSAAALDAIGVAPLATDPDDGGVPDLESVDAPMEVEIVGPQQVP